MSKAFRRRPLGADAVQLLLEVLEGSRAELSAAAAALGLGGAQLLESGLLTRTGDKAVVATDDDHDDAPVSVQPFDDKGAVAYYSSTSGVRRVDAASLGQFRADIPAILQAACRNLGLPRGARPTAVHSDLVWEIGPVRLPGRRHTPTTWFARRLWDRRARETFMDASGRRPHSEQRILLTSSATERMTALVLPGFIIVPVQDALVATHGIELSASVIAGRLKAPETADSAAAGAPRRYVLTADKRLLTIDGSVELNFKPGEAMEAIAKLVKAQETGARFAIGELASNGTMRRLFGSRWAKLKPYLKSVDGRWALTK